MNEPQARGSKKTGVPADAVGRLYAESPAQFTAQRNALAKRLRDEGDKAAAQEVGSLKKPTTAAWLVNQLAHNEPKALDQFTAVARDLQAAQDEALEGSGGDHLRRAARAGRDSIEGLVQIVRRVGDGASEATFDRVRETLEAAIADPEARAAVTSGRLERELRPGGQIPRASARAKPKQDDARIRRETAAAERELRELRKRLERAEADEQRLRDERDLAEKRLAESRASLREAEKAARKLRSEAGSAERRLEGR
jgi:hypothetical protein